MSIRSHQQLQCSTPEYVIVSERKVYRLRMQSSLSQNGMCDVSECKAIVSEHIMLCLGTFFTLSHNGKFVISEHEIIVSTW